MLNHLKTWLKNRPIWQITLLVLVPFPLLSAYGIWFGSQRSLNAKFDAIRAQGLPTNVEELNEYYSVPVGVTDSTDLWLAAFEALESADLDNRAEKLPYVGLAKTPAFNEDWQEFSKAKQLIEEMDDELDLIRKAAEAGGQIRYPNFLSADELDSMTTLINERLVARFLSLAVQVHIRSGNCNAAITDVSSILSLSNALEGEVTMISALLRIALHAMGMAQLELILSECEFNADQCFGIQKIVLDSNIRKSMITTLNGELALILSGIDQLPITTLKTANKHDALNYFGEFFATLKLPWKEILRLQRGKSVKIVKNRPGTIQLMKSVATTSLAPAHEQFIVANMKAVARQRCTNAALAAKRYQLSNGMFPKSLQDIPQELLSTEKFSKELLIDPFNGEPLRYQLEENRLLIYSVGENQIDDGGDCPRDDFSIGLDIGFLLKIGK